VGLRTAPHNYWRGDGRDISDRPTAPPLQGQPHWAGHFLYSLAATLAPRACRTMVQDQRTPAPNTLLSTTFSMRTRLPFPTLHFSHLPRRATTMLAPGQVPGLLRTIRGHAALLASCLTYHHSTNMPGHGRMGQAWASGRESRLVWARACSGTPLRANCCRPLHFTAPGSATHAPGRRKTKGKSYAFRSSPNRWHPPRLLISTFHGWGWGLG